MQFGIIFDRQDATKSHLLMLYILILKENRLSDLLINNAKD